MPFDDGTQHGQKKVRKKIGQQKGLNGWSGCGHRLTRQLVLEVSTARLGRIKVALDDHANA